MSKREEWGDAYYRSVILPVVTKLLRYTQECGFLVGRELVAVTDHVFTGGGPDDFSRRGFGPTEHIYTVELDDGSVVRLGDNRWGALVREVQSETDKGAAA